ncbi:CPCC family cysteine-rich protein [Aeromicrobium fastidiosum]|uniref:Cysteine-rich CPCC domain-containing protein n=1 Tax=Aeromicrobium fastidiosum TaxID=52699 RepID=A0A641AK00_9ACTN|nr:hypothetical protein ESP62_014700 [Aeromicrobium fastidiosum]
MHPCPCRGYRTLPGQGDYDLCPVYWWEDEGLETKRAMCFQPAPRSSAQQDVGTRVLRQRRHSPSSLLAWRPNP